MKRAELEHLAATYLEPKLMQMNGWGLIRIRDFFFPIFAQIFFEMIYHEPCPPDVLDMIVESV